MGSQYTCMRWICSAHPRVPWSAENCGIGIHLGYTYLINPFGVLLVNTIVLRRRSVSSPSKLGMEIRARRLSNTLQDTLMYICVCGSVDVQDLVFHSCFKEVL